MLVKTFCAAVMGLEATTITIEVNMTRGVMFRLSGLADTAVKESYDRIRAAMDNIGFKPPTADITINLSPADIRKEGTGYDLPLATGILAAHGKVDCESLGDYMMIGELGLDGNMKPISGALPIAIRARAEKFKGLIVPLENAREAAVVNNLEIYGMDSLSDVVSFFNGEKEKYQPTIVDTRKEFYEQQYAFDLDFAEVKKNKDDGTLHNDNWIFLAIGIPLLILGLGLVGTVIIVNIKASQTAKAQETINLHTAPKKKMPSVKPAQSTQTKSAAVRSTPVKKSKSDLENTLTKPLDIPEMDKDKK